MRVYLAATPGRLRELSGGSADGAWEGFAAVPGIHDQLGGVDDEELEYALSVAAGEASAALGADSAVPGRRLVVVADVDQSEVTPDPDAPGAVTVRGPLSTAQVAAVLADEGPHAASSVRGDDLGWYAVQEIPDLLA